MDNGQLNGVIFIDLKKTFDAVDHGILLQKLECYGVDTAGIRWFESYLFARTQKCVVNGKLSNSVKDGVSLQKSQKITTIIVSKSNRLAIRPFLFETLKNLIINNLRPIIIRLRLFHFMGT